MPPVLWFLVVMRAAVAVHCHSRALTKPCDSTSERSSRAERQAGFSGSTAAQGVGQKSAGAKLEGLATTIPLIENQTERIRKENRTPSTRSCPRCRNLIRHVIIRDRVHVFGI